MPQIHHLHAAAHYIESCSSSENWVFLLTSVAILASDDMAFMKIKRNKCNMVPGPLAPLEAVCAEVAEDQMQTVTQGYTEFSGSPLVAFGNLLLRSGTVLSWLGLAGLLSRKITQNNTLVGNTTAYRYFGALKSYKNLVCLTGGSWNLQILALSSDRKKSKVKKMLKNYLYLSVCIRFNGVTLEVLTSLQQMSSTRHISLPPSLFRFFIINAYSI